MYAIVSERLQICIQIQQTEQCRRQSCARVSQYCFLTNSEVNEEDDDDMIEVLHPGIVMHLALAVCLIMSCSMNIHLGNFLRSLHIYISLNSEANSDLPSSGHIFLISLPS